MLFHDEIGVPLRFILLILYSLFDSNSELACVCLKCNSLGGCSLVYKGSRAYPGSQDQGRRDLYLFIHAKLQSTKALKNSRPPKHPKAQGSHPAAEIQNSDMIYLKLKFGSLNLKNITITTLIAKVQFQV